jgi:hypothetical protein
MRSVTMLSDPCGNLPLHALPTLWPWQQNVCWMLQWAHGLAGAV